MRRLISAGLAAVLLLAMAPAVMSVFHGLSRSTSEASSSGLTCSVKASCSGSEVAVFRMSSTSNAHAGTVDGSTYDNVVCCSGPAGLGTSCSGVHDTVLFLSATDNAHVASNAGYPTGEEVCLSTTTEEAVDCTTGSACSPEYACLATISGSTNAHVADCDSSDDYGTKVCCYAGPALAPAVGGIQALPDVAGSAIGSSSPPYAALAGAAAGVVALLAGGWYAKRRRRAG